MALLNCEDLELLQAVVRSGTLTAAASVVHLSQPAITRRIQAVERRVRVKLFQRAGRRLQLTEAGEEFLRRSSDILDRLRDLEDEMHALSRGQRGVLRIGATATVCVYILAPILRRMRQQYPQYELFVVNESSRRMPELVREGLVDVGIASIGTALAGLSIQPWLSLHLGLLQPSSSSEPVSIQELQGQPLVMSSPGSLRSAVDSALRAHEVQPRIAAQADSLEVVRMLVACGFGSAVVPLEVMQDEVARLGLTLSPFIEAVDPLPVACFYRRLTPPLRSLMELGANHFRATHGS